MFIKIITLVIFLRKNVWGKTSKEAWNWGGLLKSQWEKPMKENIKKWVYKGEKL